jgi:predicted PurR-regulated permease PerM
MTRSDEERTFTSRVTAAAIQLSILGAWVVLSTRFVRPFFFPVLWGAIIATAVSPLTTRLFPGRRKLGAVVFSVFALTLIIAPSLLLLDSIVESLSGIGKRLAQGELKLPPPDPRVAAWPLVGERMFAAWQHAFDTPSVLGERIVPLIRPVGRWLMQSAGDLLSALGESLIAVVLATVFLSHAEACDRGLRSVAERLIPERGAKLTELAGATVRSVAQGVLGVALLQSMAGALGMFVAAIPGAALWSALVLLVALMQLPPLLVLGPASVWVFSHRSATFGVMFLIWSILVSVSDGVLKPFLLGRGVSVPTVVILIGAIGGMISDGIIGLFVGAVVLAVSYELVLAWLKATPSPS